MTELLAFDFNNFDRLSYVIFQILRYIMLQLKNKILVGQDSMINIEIKIVFVHILNIEIDICICYHIEFFVDRLKS